MGIRMFTHWWYVHISYILLPRTLLMSFCGCAWADFYVCVCAPTVRGSPHLFVYMLVHSCLFKCRHSYCVCVLIWWRICTLHVCVLMCVFALSVSVCPSQKSVADLVLDAHSHSLQLTGTMATERSSQPSRRGCRGMVCGHVCICDLVSTSFC